MKSKFVFETLVIILTLAPLPSLAQSGTAQMADTGLSSCGTSGDKFVVKESRAQQPTEPEPGKALVYFIEEDLNTQIVTHTTRAGIDGKWMGAAYGTSWFSFTVDPGLHHICATTQIGSDTDDVLTSLAHFAAEAGGVYYFEMKNISMINGAKEYTNDATLSALDSDEGKYLTHSLPLVVSRPKK
jgi:hypothetical protein